MISEPSLVAVERGTITSAVVASIRRAIISGELPPGARLTEKQLTERLEVSRTPVREAISRLVHEGYLKGKPYQGYRVNLPTPEDIREAYEVLAGLTEMVAKLAMKHADAQEIAHLISLANEASQALARGDTANYADIGHQFRLDLAAAGHNRLLERLHAQHLDHPSLVVSYAVDDLPAVRQRATDFTAIMAALRQRDGAGVASALQDNLQKMLRDVLTERGAPLEDVTD
jgi:DNA-binding GntR family transcriptional regulator